MQKRPAGGASGCSPRALICVSWLVSAGAPASSRTGRGEAETETFADGVWIPPDAGAAYLWGRAGRPPRAGVAFAGSTATIAP